RLRAAVISLALAAAAISAGWTREQVLEQGAPDQAAAASELWDSIFGGGLQTSDESLVRDAFGAKRGCVEPVERLIAEMNAYKNWVQFGWDSGALLDYLERNPLNRSYGRIRKMLFGDLGEKGSCFDAVLRAYLAYSATLLYAYGNPQAPGLECMA